MDRETSDKIATAASHIMSGAGPLDDDKVVDTIIRNVLDAAATGTQEDARDAIREPLRQFIETAKSLAASCVSQADGHE